MKINDKKMVNTVTGIKFVKICFLVMGITCFFYIRWTSRREKYVYRTNTSRMKHTEYSLINRYKIPHNSCHGYRKVYFLQSILKEKKFLFTVYK